MAIICQVESGDLLGAWNEAQQWVKRRPDQAGAFFSRSYVLRYAGELEEAMADCERSRQMDPEGRLARSCYQVPLRLGREKEAMLFVERDKGGDWYHLSRGWIELSFGRPEKAREEWAQLAERQPISTVSQACLGRGDGRGDGPLAVGPALSLQRWRRAPSGNCTSWTAITSNCSPTAPTCANSSSRA